MVRGVLIVALLIAGSSLPRIQAGSVPKKLGLTDFVSDDHESDHDNNHHGHDHDHGKHGHHCVHDTIQHPPLLRNFLNVHARNASIPVRARRQLLRTWDGSNGDTGDVAYSEAACTTTGAAAKGFMRLQTSEQDVSGLSNEYLLYLRNTLMPTVKAYWERTLTVVPLASNLLVASPAGVLAGSGTEGITISNDDRTVGFAADYLLYYSAIATTTCTSNSGTLAYAAAFEVTECDRPLVGYINFCPTGLTALDTATLDGIKQLTTAKHEVTHALGYSFRHYAYYRNQDMSPRTTRDATGVPNLGYDTVALSSTGLNSDGSATLHRPNSAYFSSYTDPVLGGTRWKMKTEKVLEKARAHYACTGLDGVEMENQGSSGSWGSHWEKRIIGNEYMSAVTIEIDSPVSEITLGLLEDMGWWGVIYSGNTDSYPWMKNVGCDTIEKMCMTDGTSINPAYFCDTESSVQTCTFDGLAVGYCNKNSATNLASYYYHWGDMSTAGSLSYADYCPIKYHYSNKICAGYKADGTMIVQSEDETAQGAEYGSTAGAGNSRCFTSSLYTDSLAFQPKTAACYKYQCLTSTSLEISIYSTLQNYTAVCSTGTAGNELSVNNFAGTITCPNPSDTAVCGSDGSFPTLSALAAVSGTTSMSERMVPPFSMSTSNYRINVGHAISSMEFTPTLYSSALVTLTHVNSDGILDVITSGTVTSAPLALDPAGSLGSYTPVSFVVETAAGQSRTYTVGITRSANDMTPRTVTLTLNLAFSSVTNLTEFHATVKAEIVSILSLADSDQVTMWAVFEGSTKTQMAFNYINDTNPDPYTLDATLQSLFNDKNSVFFNSAKYQYLSYATLYQSTSNFTICNSTYDEDGNVKVKNTCESQFCDVATGLCINITDEGGDNFPTWALIVIIIGSLLIIGFVVFCIVKSLYKICCPDLCSDVAEVFQKFQDEAGKQLKTPAVFQPIDRSQGRQEVEAKYDAVKLNDVKLVDNTRFKDLMDDASSDDGDGQI